MSIPRNPNDLIRIEDAIKVLCRKTCYPGIACPDIYCKEMWDEFEDVERVNAFPVNGMDDEQSRIESVLSGKTPEEQYDILYWLMMEYGKGHSNSRLARIEWLKRKGGDNHD